MNDLFNTVAGKVVLVTGGSIGIGRYIAGACTCTMRGGRSRCCGEQVRPHLQCGRGAGSRVVVESDGSSH